LRVPRPALGCIEAAVAPVKGHLPSVLFSIYQILSLDNKFRSKKDVVALIFQSFFTLLTLFSIIERITI
jgi:hypothetical protein